MTQTPENDTPADNGRIVLPPQQPARVMEPGCIGLSHEKKYFVVGNDPSEMFIKRSLEEREYTINWRSEMVIPRFVKERLQNEAAAIRYVKEHTNIPVPVIRGAFEDCGRYYLLEDVVPGVLMAELSDEQKAVVTVELEQYIDTLHSIKSKMMGGLAGSACLPYRLDMALKERGAGLLEFRGADEPEFVLCHGDLSQHNVIVDESTLKINGIIDWEYAGFYPSEFEGRFYKRPGPSAAIDGEIDDVPLLLQLVEKWQKQ
ncbi:kinase-like protein [Heliocybe sulcata]|uniref:Kinase-like protein n=1 Tax=Heliocybe sulcata TaxID=5364 RepID=A0A5C3N7A1_9AGAM|nr:kinase-like protein [Heliocybe sulcata]